MSACAYSPACGWFGASVSARALATGRKHVRRPALMTTRRTTIIRRTLPPPRLRPCRRVRGGAQADSQVRTNLGPEPDRDHIQGDTGNEELSRRPGHGQRVLDAARSPTPGGAVDGSAVAPRALAMYARSAGETPGCSSGLFRNPAEHAGAPAVPTPPSTRNAVRQPVIVNSQAIAGSAKAAPSLGTREMMPCASPRSPAGS